MAIERPKEFRINAWDGDQTPVLAFRAPENSRVLTEHRPLGLAPPYLEKPWDWRSPDVGWGLVLRDNDELSAKDKAVAADAPEPIRRLLAARAGAPILRYQPNKAPGYLFRYYLDGHGEPLSAEAPDRGIREGQIPQYLLIYGTPAEIPWAVQYGLNLSAFVGRLDLTVEEGLDRYVDSLISDWAGHDPADITNPVIWSTDWGLPDITFLMARIIGAKLAVKFAADAETAERIWLTGPTASREELGAALKSRRPSFICTTSHGMTGPLRDQQATISHLGSPVDSTRQPVTQPDLSGWEPGGAIWYAHACCSAGSDSISRYAGLIGADEQGGALLRGVAAAAGARVAPLPRALLGGANPLAAFVGHVEPTFDWTLRDPNTKQELAHTIVRCLYDRLHTSEHRAPIGWALADIFKEAGAFYGWWQAPEDADDRVTLDVYRQLAAMDRQSTVILGDPTVAICQRSS
jgi:hypothetical protein